MIKNWVGFYTLSSREIMRFFSVWRQTIIPGIVTTLLYIFVFGVALENRISEIGGVSYNIYLTRLTNDERRYQRSCKFSLVNITNEITSNSS